MRIASRGFQRWAVLPCAHVPWHNRELLPKVLKFVKDLKVYGLILPGDFLDLFSLSQYAANSLYQLRDLTLTQEYVWGKMVLKDIENALPRGCKKHYLYGNHEARYLSHLKDGDNAKVGDELRAPEEALGLNEKGWMVYTNWKDDAVKLGEHLEVIHGFYTPVHAAKKHLDEFQGSVMFGHTHRFQSYVTSKRGAYNIGYLGDPNSPGFKYVPRVHRTRWVNGFAVVNVDDNGYYWVEMIQAWGNRFIANGKLY